MTAWVTLGSEDGQWTRAHQVNASLTSEELKFAPLWAITFRGPLGSATQGDGGSQTLGIARQPGQVPDQPGVLPECRMSKPRVQLRGKILQISFCTCMPGRF